MCSEQPICGHGFDRERPLPIKCGRVRLAARQIEWPAAAGSERVSHSWLETPTRREARAENLFCWEGVHFVRVFLSVLVWS